MRTPNFAGSCGEFHCSADVPFPKPALARPPGGHVAEPFVEDAACFDLADELLASVSWTPAPQSPDRGLDLSVSEESEDLSPEDGADEKLAFIEPTFVDETGDSAAVKACIDESAAEAAEVEAHASPDPQE